MKTAEMKLFLDSNFVFENALLMVLQIPKQKFEILQQLSELESNKLSILLLSAENNFSHFLIDYFSKRHVP